MSYADPTGTQPTAVAAAVAVAGDRERKGVPFGVRI